MRRPPGVLLCHPHQQENGADCDQRETRPVRLDAKTASWGRRFERFDGLARAKPPGALTEHSVDAHLKHGDSSSGKPASSSLADFRRSIRGEGPNFRKLLLRFHHDEETASQ